MGAGSGGGTGYTTVIPYIEDVHSMLLFGKDSFEDAGVSWDGSTDTSGPLFVDKGTYKGNPSVLRFLHERGITDAGGNPYEGVSTYDPTTELASTESGVQELRDEIDTVSPTGDWTGFIQSALAQVDAAVSELDVSTLVGTAIDSAITKAAEVALANGATARSETAATFSEFKGAADTITSNLEIAARTASATSADTVMSGVSPNVASIINSAIIDLKTSAQSVISDAAAMALEVVNGTQIDTVVESYRKQLLRTHLRGVNRFAGGMADIGAVNSSAFIMGMALMESDYTTEVASFQGKLELEVYNTILTSGLNQYTEIFRTTFAQYMDSYERRFQQELDIYKTNLPVYVQTFLSTLPEFVRTYLQTYMTNTQSLDSFARDELGETVKARLTERQSKLGFALSGSQLINGISDGKLNKRYNVIALLEHSNRSQIVAKSEQYVRDLLYDVQSSTWDIDLFQKASNMLSASAGAVVADRTKPTDTQTVLGSMAAGASIGATAKGIPGALAGAAIGGILGGIDAYSN